MLGAVKLLQQPIIVVPSMNSCMYENPLTDKQIRKMIKMNIIVLKSLHKVLICGDKGNGAMQDPSSLGGFKNSD